MKLRKLIKFLVDFAMMKLGYLPFVLAPRLGWLASPMSMNQVLKGEGFYISYIPINRDATLPVEQRVGTKEKCETAIIFPKPGSDEVDEEGEPAKTFLVLNGDHREAYEKRIGDLSDCIEYYADNKEKYNSWFSTDNEQAREEAKK